MYLLFWGGIDAWDWNAIVYRPHLHDEIPPWMSQFAGDMNMYIAQKISWGEYH